MDGRVASLADDEGLPPAGQHVLDPARLLSSSLPSLLEVRQLPDVVHLDAIHRAADLAFVRQEPLDEVGPGRSEAVRFEGSIHDHEERVRLEAEAAESCHFQRVLMRILPL